MNCYACENKLVDGHNHGESQPEPIEIEIRICRTCDKPFEIPVHNQGDKMYCEHCKPQGHSTKGIEVVSGYEVCCHGCGESFREIAEKSLPCGDIEDPAVQQRMLATNERIAHEDRRVEEFWCLMAEAQ